MPFSVTRFCVPAIYITETCTNRATMCWSLLRYTIALISTLTGARKRELPLAEAVHSLALLIRLALKSSQ
jgi:hypothetical protein